MDDIGDRVRAVRDALHISQTDLAKRLGVSSAAISKIESGQRQPSVQLKLSLCREYGISREWLDCGEGQMQDTDPDDIGQLITKLNLPPESRMVVDAYLRLKPGQQKAVLAYVYSLADVLSEQGRQKSWIGKTAKA